MKRHNDMKKTNPRSLAQELYALLVWDDDDLWEHCSGKWNEFENCSNGVKNKIQELISLRIIATMKTWSLRSAKGSETMVGRYQMSKWD